MLIFSEFFSILDIFGLPLFPPLPPRYYILDELLTEYVKFSIPGQYFAENLGNPNDTFFSRFVLAIALSVLAITAFEN